MTSFASDRLSESDALNRAPFARKLLGVVCSVDVTNGAVIGLAGSWGSGKSWILNKAEEIHKQESIGSEPDPSADQIHWVSFSPWALSGSDTLIEAMLIEIAQQIRLDTTFSNRLAERAKFAESMLGYVIALTKVRHVLPILTTALSVGHPTAAIVAGGLHVALDAANTQGEKVKGLISKVTAKSNGKEGKESNRQAGATIREKGALQGSSLREARERVRSALKELGGRVVIVIDDLDRMAPKEMVEILQTVKAVADFPQVVYVLAYDPVITASALEKTLQVQSGVAFLEKIVRVPLEVPDPSPVKLMQATLKMMVQVRTSLKIPLSKENESRAQLTAALMRRPRDLVRLRSRMEFVLPQLVRAMDLDDVTLVLALQIKAPEVVNYINENRAFFFDPGHLGGDEILKTLGHVGDDSWGFDDYKEKGQSVNEELARMVKTLGQDGRLVANSLKALNLAKSGSHHEVESKHMRVFNLGNWIRLRGASNDNVSMDNDDLMLLLEKPALMRNSALLDSSDTAYALFMRLEPFLRPAVQDRYSEIKIDVPALADILNELVADFGEECRFSDGSLWPSEFVRGLFKNASPEVQIEIVRASLGKQCLHDTGLLLVEASQDFKQHSSADFSALGDELAIIVGQWKAAAYQFIKEPMSSPLDDWRPGRLISDLLALGETPESVAKCVEASIDSKPEQGLARWLLRQPIHTNFLGFWENLMRGWPSPEYFGRLVTLYPHALSNKPDLANALLGALHAPSSSQE